MAKWSSLDKRISRSKAIRLKCLDCSAQQQSEVKRCPCVDCPLWRYRMGYEERDELYIPKNTSKRGVFLNETCEGEQEPLED